MAKSLRAQSVTYFDVSCVCPYPLRSKVNNQNFPSGSGDFGLHRSASHLFIGPYHMFNRVELDSPILCYGGDRRNQTCSSHLGYFGEERPGQMERRSSIGNRGRRISHIKKAQDMEEFCMQSARRFLALEFTA